MLFSLFLAGLLIFTAGCATSQTADQSNRTEPITSTDALLKYQDQISTDFLYNHLAVLSADSMEGRETATKGLKKAADYLADQYRAIGLQPVGDDGSYFQRFELNATKSDSVVFTTYKTDTGGEQLVDRSVSAAGSSGRYIRSFGGTDTLSGQIVFAGFGVNDDGHNVRHLKGLDLNGKWVMVFEEIPHVIDGDTLISEEFGARSRFRSILGKGAAGILVIPDLSAEEFDSTAMLSQANFGEPSNLRLAYRDSSSGRSGGFSRGYNRIDPALAANLLEVSSLDEYRSELIENIGSFQPKELGYKLTQIPYSSEISLETKNVLAFYEGADPELKDEVVVLTAHYDHLGIGQPDSTGDRIYNGADDDGSGTIGLLNVAHAFAEAGEQNVKPKRSILFLHVSGEEKGLLGSRYYSDHPVFPIEKTIADINTDMIGRVDAEHKKEGIEEYTYIIGADIISSELDSLVNVANSRAGNLKLNKKYNDLQDPNQFYRRSDHWNFGRLGVPFVFFFTGVHEDYHRPSDEIEKIRFDKMAKIVRTIYASAVMVANTDNPPTVDNQAFIEITKED